MYRLTPLIISVRGASLTSGKERLFGVPPGMSVNTIVPSGLASSRSARAILARISGTERREEVAIARTPLRLAADDALGRLDEIGAELPVGDDDEVDHDGDVPVEFLDRVAGAAQLLRQPARAEHAAVPPARAADRDRQVRLSFLHVVRQERR